MIIVMRVKADRQILRVCLLIIIGCLMLPSIMAPVLGDGMPSYRIGEFKGEKTEYFQSVFESRQLAMVELTDDDHQRINLFLSVYSLSPGENLTIMVPLRTLPVNITGEGIKESAFREEFEIEKAEEMVVKQDAGEAWANVGESFKKYNGYTFGSSLFTFPGEYSRQNFKLGYSDYDSDSDGTKSEGGGSLSLDDDPEPVQHYEVDGFSIDVFGVSAGPKLRDYLEEKGLVLPDSNVWDSYMDQYVAVIESESKPPINSEKYEVLQTFAPNTTKWMIDYLKEYPRIDVDSWYFEHDLDRQLRKERGYSMWDDDPYEYDESIPGNEGLTYYLIDLARVLTGRVDFAGEVLKIDLPLDNGKIFFPLGTSAGWETEVGDIDVLFKVPDDKALEIKSSEDCYFNGHHYYLFQLQNANPGYDLDSTVQDGSMTNRNNRLLAGWANENDKGIGFLFGVLLYSLLWILIFVLIQRRNDKKKLFYKDPWFWIAPILSVVISIPLTAVIYLLIRPKPLKELVKEVPIAAMFFMYVISIPIIILGVLI